MSTDMQITVAGLLVALVLALIVLWRQHVTAAAVERLVRGIAPDGAVEDLAVKAAMIAYKAVEQRARQFEDMSDQARLELAMKWLTALYDYWRSGKLSPDAKEALLEHELYLQHAGTAAREAIAQ